MPVEEWKSDGRQADGGWDERARVCSDGKPGKERASRTLHIISAAPVRLAQAGALVKFIWLEGFYGPERGEKSALVLGGENVRAGQDINQES